MGKIDDKFLKLQISDKARMAIYRKLMKFLRNGISLPKALDTLYLFASDDGRKPKAPQAQMLQAWRTKVRNGETLGRAINGWVPNQDVVVIASGENAGSTDVALQNAVFIKEGSKRIKSAIVGGLAYPTLLVMVVFAFLYIISSQVVPAFDSVVPKEQWTGNGATLATLADMVDLYMRPGIVAIVTSIVLLYFSLPRFTGKYRTKLDKYPPYSLYRLTMGSGFLLSMSGMISAGISVTKALRLMARDANPYYKERINGALKYVNEGKNLGEALYMSGFNFPDKEAVMDLRAYASLDGFDKTLSALGEQWMEDSVEKIKAQSAILKNGAFIFLGVVFGWLVMAIFSLQQQITNGL